MPTEHEMREFFQSVVDQVATLSTQAARVEGLEQRINELNQRMNELVEQNGQLQRDLSQANDTIRTVQGQYEAVQQSLDNEKAVTANLRDVLVQRDTKVQELDGNLSAERDAHRITLSERDDARKHGEELTLQVESFRNELQTVRQDRDTWQHRAMELEAEVHDLKQRLDRVNSILNPPRPVSQDAQVA